MKNMMSLVKRWSKSPIFNFQFAILLAVLLIGAGCENSDPVVNPGDTPNPNWELTVENDLMSSMTAIVKVSFAEKEGILAAFIGDDCCGVASSENYIEGRYHLYISPSEQGDDVQLKFYSPDLKRIFVAKKTFKYTNDDRLGTVDAPYTPEWTVAK